MEKMSPLSVLIVGVADWVVVTTRGCFRLFVNVFVELMEGMTTPSTAITPAWERVIVVSAFPTLNALAMKSCQELPAKSALLAAKPEY